MPPLNIGLSAKLGKIHPALLGRIPLALTKAGLTNSWPYNIDLRERQMDRMRSELETNTTRERIVEFVRAGLVIDHPSHRCLICKADKDIAGQGGYQRICPVDLAIRADGLDPVEVYGISEFGHDHIADNLTIGLDRAGESRKARGRQIGQGPCRAGGRNGLSLDDNAGCCCQRPRATHLPSEAVELAVRIHRIAWHLKRRGFDPEGRKVPVGQLNPRSFSGGSDCLGRTNGCIEPEVYKGGIDRNENFAISRYRASGGRQRNTAIAA